MQIQVRADSFNSIMATLTSAINRSITAFEKLVLRGLLAYPQTGVKDAFAFSLKVWGAFALRGS